MGSLLAVFTLELMVAIQVHLAKESYESTSP
jgi:hypothetical protein